jgi:flagellar biosynthesis/type III secretory pathway chaperone
VVEPALTDPIRQAQDLATQLSQILEREFEALRNQELDQFEQLQPVKNELLLEITRLAPNAQDVQTLPKWQAFRQTMIECRDLHRRNTVLMDRKLEAIRGTLQSLRLQDASSSVEVYDRLGHISRFSRNTGYSDA